jgi:integrase
MATARARHGSYLFQRPGSSNWYIKLRSPGVKRKEISLGTDDRRQAEILALPHIAEHKRRLLESRPRLVTRPYTVTPGEYTVDGERVIATEREIIYLKPDGALIRTEPNSPSQELVNMPMGAVVTFGKPTRPLAELRGLGPVIDMSKLERRTAVTKGGDDAILEVYLKNAKHGPVTGYDEREARAVWALFKTLTNGKPLKDADRDDGRKLVAHFDAQGLKSATIEKKIAWLNAACNLAIKDGKLKLNPFAAITPKRKDKLRRKPLNDADIRLVKHNLDKLNESDRLLFRMLASTGMRIGEAFEIAGEEKERGVRYVIVGHKTEESLRRVPLSASVLAFLPRTIKGPLFASHHVDPADAASKRLNKFLRAIGITDPSKVVHSLRHRAQDRLRAAGCPEDIRWSILGHERETVAAGYGEGFPVRVLKQWIDKIGF